MNSPYMTQSQRENVLAARASAAGDPERVRRALRLDNPFMHGVYTADHPGLIDSRDIPTPTFNAG